MTQLTTMPSSKTKPNSITNFEASFSMFRESEFISGIDGFGTLQPLHNNDKAYWAVKEESLKACKWTATEKDFDKDSVLWNHSHRFHNGARELMHAFIKPRIQIIHTSNILVVDDSILDRSGKSMNMIIGDLSMPHVAKAFEVDKEKAGDNGNRQYSTRTKYLVNILTKDNQPAHEVPLVFTVKGLASVDMSRMLKEFTKQMNRCYSTGLELKSDMRFDERTQAGYVFVPELDIRSVDARGNRKVSIPAIVDYKKPDYSTVEKAKESMFEYSIPIENREHTWEQMKDDFLGNYINKHSEQEAAKLNGAYGIADGVPALMPKAVVAVLPEGAEDTGEDAAL